MQQHFNTIESCRICSYTEHVGKLEPILDLGMTPLADSFLSSQSTKQERFPLRLSVCRNCFLVQMVDEVDKNLLFNSDYGFFTGASPSSIAYFKDYATSVMREYPKETEELIVEIASNDGTLLSHFVDEGKEVLGIDPASNTVKVANEAGIRSIAKHFSLETALEVLEEYGKAGVIMANNVVAHIDTIHNFLAGVENLLSDEGVFIAEVQYLPHLLFNNAFDHVYHEHRSFFSLAPLIKLFDLHGLTITDVIEADTQGGSIRVYARHKWVNNGNRLVSPQVNPSVNTLLEYELSLGLNRIETYLGFQQRVDYIKDKLVKLLTSLKRDGKTVYGFGASAKGNTLLNYCKIGPDLLDCVVDLTEYKIGKYTPGMKIPVKNPVQVNDPDYYLLLVWNYLPGVLKRNKEFLGKGGHFIVPIPCPMII